jgi:hypothetical protein
MILTAGAKATHLKPVYLRLNKNDSEAKTCHLYYCIDHSW